MKDLKTVICFTAKDMLKRKSFIISTIIILIFIVIGFNIPNIIKSFEGDNVGDQLLIIDNEDIFEGSLENLKEMDLGYEIQVESKKDISYDNIKEKIENEEIDSAIMIEPQENNNNVKVRYIVKNTNFIEEVPEDIITAINSLYSNMQISKLGLTNEQIQSVTPNFEFDIEQTEEKASGNIFVMMLLSIVLFYAIYFCAYQVSSSITTEKTSKIIETLVTSTSPKTIVLGKTIGIGIVRIITINFNCRNSFYLCKVILRA